MILIISLITFVFVFFVPFYLKKNADVIKPTKNIFDKFVENDHGYPWSRSKERKDSYQDKLNERRKKNIK